MKRVLVITRLNFGFNYDVVDRFACWLSRHQVTLYCGNRDAVKLRELRVGAFELKLAFDRAAYEYLGRPELYAQITQSGVVNFMDAAVIESREHTEYALELSSHIHLAGAIKSDFRLTPLVLRGLGIGIAQS